MKLLITFVLGALTGAFLLWFAFAKTILPLDKHLVAVDRFTGKASQVFVSRFEAMQLGDDENARLEALDGKAKPSPASSEWRKLSDAEIKQLEFEWQVYSNSNHTSFKFHNPFAKNVKIEKVRVRIPAKEGAAAIDREYEMDELCPALSDLSGQIRSINMQGEEFYQTVADQTPQVSGSGPDPFGSAPSGKKTTRRLVGTITPVQASIQP